MTHSVTRVDFDSDLLTTQEAAHATGLSVHTLNTYRHLKRPPAYVKKGRQVRYRISDLQKYLDKSNAQEIVEG
jgi:predicted DNA-binding transcriptional regulator AlpA